MLDGRDSAIYFVTGQIYSIHYVTGKRYSYILYDRTEIRQYYPNKFLQYDDHRIYIMNTLFNVPGES